MEVLSPRVCDVGRYVTEPLKLPDCNALIIRVARGTWAEPEPGGRAVAFELSDGNDGFWVQGLETEILRVGMFGLFGGKWLPMGHNGTQGGELFYRRAPNEGETGPQVGDRIDETVREVFLYDKPTEVKLVFDCLGRVDTKIDIEPVTLSRLSFLKGPDEHHSIAVEDVRSGTATAGNSSVSTSANLTPAGDDRYIAIIGGNGEYATAAGYTSMAFGADTAVQIGTVVGFYNRVSAARVVNPSTTPALCSYVVANTENRMGIVAIAFSGVDQDDPDDAPVTSGANTNAPSVTVTAGEAGDIRLAGSFSQGEANNLSTGTNEVQQADLSWGGGNASLHVQTKEDGGSDAMNWGNSATSWCASIGFNINMAAEVGGAALSIAPIVQNYRNMGIH